MHGGVYRTKLNIHESIRVNRGKMGHGMPWHPHGVKSDSDIVEVFLRSQRPSRGVSKKSETQNS